MTTRNRKRQTITFSKRSKVSHEKKMTISKKRRLVAKNTSNTTTNQKLAIDHKTKTATPFSGKAVENKKLARKERNRVNARRFRERRKMYVGTLEKETKELKKENTSLISELEKVNKQNVELLKLIEELKNNTTIGNNEQNQKEQVNENEQIQIQIQIQEPEQEPEQEQEEGVLSSKEIYEIESPLPPNNFYEDLEVSLQNSFQDFERSTVLENGFGFPNQQQDIYDKHNEKQTFQWLNFPENSSYETNIFDSNLF
ncbi:b-zip transcription factor (eurofung) [Anaeramoeba flamelloides]|uniref:B-zip transcription factor (Eurofung) n=1 Tax=Anaeramoeba flamelloides TaxID=1746091 RepID=A0AAV8AIK2_9EUKA|nr:b-zip transcription factor (eurofung) [Anaeramoeba flamelloides]